MRLRQSLRNCFAASVAAIAATASLAQEPLKVGFIAPLSGPFASYGQKFQNGIKAYMQVHGDTVAGRKVEVIYRDNAMSSPEVARRLAQELVTRDKVQVLTGFALTPDALAVGPLATQAKTPTVLMLAASSGIPAMFPYLTRVSYSMSQAASPIGTWAARNGVKKVFTLVSDYGPGIDSETTFAKSFASQGGEVVGSLRVPINAIDFAPYVQRIRDSSADAVFVFVPTGDPMTAFMKSFVERGLVQKGIRVLSNTDLSQEYLRMMGDASLHIISGTHFFETLDNPENKVFQKAYGAVAAGEPGGAIAIGGWDGMSAIYEAVRKTKGKFDGESLMLAFRGLSLKSPRGPLLIDPVTKDVVQTIYIAKVEKRGDRYAPVVIDKFENMKDLGTSR